MGHFLPAMVSLPGALAVLAFELHYSYAGEEAVVLLGLHIGRSERL